MVVFCLRSRGEAAAPFSKNVIKKCDQECSQKRSENSYQKCHRKSHPKCSQRYHQAHYQKSFRCPSLGGVSPRLCWSGAAPCPGLLRQPLHPQPDAPPLLPPVLLHRWGPPACPRFLKKWMAVLSLQDPPGVSHPCTAPSPKLISGNQHPPPGEGQQGDLVEVFFPVTPKACQKMLIFGNFSDSF